MAKHIILTDSALSASDILLVTKATLPQAISGLSAGDYTVRTTSAPISGTVSSAEVKTAPAAFGASDWAVATGSGAGQITLTVSALPSNGGSAITALQYSLDGGTIWTALSGATAGAYTVNAAASGTAYTASLRAVNAIGNGTAAATKTVTSGTAAAVSALPATYLFGNDNTALTDTNGGNALIGTAASLSNGYLTTRTGVSGLEIPFTEPSGAYTQIYVARPTSLTANAIIGGNLAGVATDGGGSPYFTSNGTLTVNLRGALSSISAPAASTTNFSFVAASFDKTGSAGAITGIGVNGALSVWTANKSSNTSFVSGGEARSISIGNKHYSGWSAQPAIDVAYAALYNRALTRSEIEALYASVKTALSARAITVN